MVSYQFALQFGTGYVHYPVDLGGADYLVARIAWPECHIHDSFSQAYRVGGYESV
jgi:hypothetical protein